jgi:uncharacterized membrane protein
MTDNAISGGAGTNIGSGERVGSLIAGTMLILRALSRPTLGRIAAAIGGGALLTRALTGHCALYERLGIGSNPDQTARRRRIRRSRRKDPVQEASEESFPASDPPAWTPVAGPGARD